MDWGSLFNGGIAVGIAVLLKRELRDFKTMTQAALDALGENLKALRAAHEANDVRLSAVEAANLAHFQNAQTLASAVRTVHGNTVKLADAWNDLADQVEGAEAEGDEDDGEGGEVVFELEPEKN